jgi:hypothetical protein
MMALTSKTELLDSTTKNRVKSLLSSRLSISMHSYNSFMQYIIFISVVFYNIIVLFEGRILFYGLRLTVYVYYLFIVCFIALFTFAVVPFSFILLSRLKNLF